MGLLLNLGELLQIGCPARVSVLISASIYQGVEVGFWIEQLLPLQHSLVDILHDLQPLGRVTSASKTHSSTAV